MSVSEAVYVIVISMFRDPKQQFLFWMEFLLSSSINRDKCALVVVGSKVDLLDAQTHQQKINEFQDIVEEYGLPPILVSSITLENVSQLRKKISASAKKILKSGFKFLPLSYATCIRQIWSSNKIVCKESPHSDVLSFFHKIGDIIYCPSSGMHG